jgi:hypothetical protein
MSISVFSQPHLPILSADYRTIQLTQGKNTLVDSDTYRKFGWRKWCAHKCGRTFYAERGFRNKSTGGTTHVKLHTAINPPPPGYEMHHKDHDGLCNIKENLEHRTHADNSTDQLKHNNATSRFKGVDFESRAKKWRAQIRADYQVIFLGYFSTEIEAARAYDAASRHYHGDMGSTNEKYFGTYW